MSRPFLGISSYYHDSAAALVIGGEVIAAAQEERFTRVRHDRSFPGQALDYCLSTAGLQLSDLGAVVFHEDPALKFERVKANFRSAGPRSFKAFRSAMPQWSEWKRDMISTIAGELSDRYPGQHCEVRNSTHHRSHAASAFFPSPYERAAVLTIDGVGEWDTTSIWHGVGSDLRKLESIPYPHSLGFLYSAFTQYCGFKVDSGEYKLMGLAPYGQPLYADLIRDKMISLKPDGSFELNLDYFAFQYGQNMVDDRFDKAIGRKRRTAEFEEIEQFHCDLAASVQDVTEDAVLALARRAKEITDADRLVMAGGVALNCVANGVVDRAAVFGEIWIQPAAGDAGCALGAALDASVAECGARPHLGTSDGMKGSLLGPEFSPEEIRQRLDGLGAVYEHYGDDVFDTTAQLLAEGAVVGWFQGRMEFGPRALGARSIIGDARSADMQRTMNLKIKYRESFRPFAPAVLDERAHEYFEVGSPSPYMLFVSKVRPELCSPGGAGGLGTINDVRSTIPAVTHVDHSARVQTVTSTGNREFYQLLGAFEKRTGSATLVNTSFNVRGEPIVLTPEHAFTCFMRTGMDILVIGPFVLRKDAQPESVAAEDDWRSQIPLD